MRALKSLLALMLIACPLSSNAQGVEQLAASLFSAKNYIEDATFEVLLPSAQDPITYTITLQSDACADTDSLSPACYLIRWDCEAPSGALQGFSAYFDGNHYRYRNAKLQEYHFDQSPEVFMPQGAGSQLKSGVQCQAQFADLLPQFIATKLQEMASDSNYTYKVSQNVNIDGRKCTVVEGTKTNAGYDVLNFKYAFDSKTSLPVMIDLETSPGAISEQLITVQYHGNTQSAPAQYTEEALIALWPDIFEKYRENNFRTESLKGSQLPEFSCQRVGGGPRYEHNRNEGFDTPVIIVALDPAVSSTQATIQAIRDAVTAIPTEVEVIYAFATNRSEAISEAIGELQPGEEALMSAGSLVRNCGISLYPTIIIANRNGIVTDVISGFNNEIGSSVIQMCALQ